jgi:periplasmic copper chaperone A
MPPTIRAPLAALLICFAGHAGAAAPAAAQSAAFIPPPGIAHSSPHVTDAWSRATAQGQPNGVVYLTVVCDGADEILGASSPVADAAELHTTLDEGGVMKMRPVSDIPLVPGKPVILAPGGLHIMLMGLHRPLKQGESFPLTLRFKNAPAATVEVAVGRPGASHPMDGMGKMPGTMTGPTAR